jgi:hypothetical protein
MKFSILILSIVLLGLSACQKQKRSAADVNIVFHHSISNQPLTIGPKSYVNAAGNQYSVDLLKYYLSHLILRNENGSEFALNNYMLIDASDPATCQELAIQVPNGTYTSLRFYLGIDSAKNYSLAQGGDLDPMYGMFWSWNTGYIFFKHEGEFIKSNGNTAQILFHLGTDKAYTAVEVPINLTVEGSSKVLNINFDLGKMYNQPLIDFNVDSVRQSTDAADSLWIENMKSNLQDAFQFAGVQ